MTGPRGQPWAIIKIERRSSTKALSGYSDPLTGGIGIRSRRVASKSNTRYFMSSGVGSVRPAPTKGSGGAAWCFRSLASMRPDLGRHCGRQLGNRTDQFGDFGRVLRQHSNWLRERACSWCSPQWCRTRVIRACGVRIGNQRPDDERKALISQLTSSTPAGLPSHPVDETPRLIWMGIANLDTRPVTSKFPVPTVLPSGHIPNLSLDRHCQCCRV